MKAEYPRIESLAAVGDGHSLALLGPDGSVEWWCPLRFDAHPALWPLLDRRRGGTFRVGPAGAGRADRVAYEPDTAIVVQEWDVGAGMLRSRAAMAWPQPRGGQQLLWQLEAVGGEVEVEVSFDPRPDWGRSRRRMEIDRDGASCTAGNLRLRLETLFPLETAGAGLGARFRLGSGATTTLRLLAARGCSPRSDAPPHMVLEAARSAWKDWTSVLRYDGPCGADVFRSAITLRLLVYEPSGAVVAAATTSLPEVIGGVRNWDYRYSWLRDAAFTLNSLYALGCRPEANAYARWLRDVVADAPLPLPVLHGIDGVSGFPETHIEEAEGYRDSRPVRVGNAAECQFQLDIYGELIECITICEVMGDPTLREAWPHFRRLVDFVADRWREPDHGIWEVRDAPRHFVHSKAQAWLALERGCGLAEAFDLEGSVPRWQAEAKELRTEVDRSGLTPDGTFARAYGSREADAALLTLPILGFVAGDDPRMLRTIDSALEELNPEGALHRGLLLRYPHRAGDGLPGAEGAFAICGFWLVEALAHAGRLQQAEQMFRALCSMRGEVGLFAEELDPRTGEHLGNTPQAFTHIGLINAALRLAHASAREPKPLGSARG